MESTETDQHHVHDVHDHQNHNHNIRHTSEDDLNPENSDDFVAFNCKSCTLPIREGHAYELKNDRWHIKCFKCSKCSKFLGVNSNFLVLGTGALVCSDCSYTCRSCGKKIYDMAILTGDKAYCASCFKCKSCKKPIDDLRYARTSKGLFCMPCHNKLMEKKKKYEAHKARKEAAVAASTASKSTKSTTTGATNNNSHNNHNSQKEADVLPLSKTESITPPRSIETSTSNSIIPTSSNTTTKSSSNYETMSQTSSSALSNIDNDVNDSSGSEINNKIQYARTDKILRSPVNTLSQFEISDYGNLPSQEYLPRDGSIDNELTITLETRNGSNVGDGLSFSPSSRKSANALVSSGSFKNLKDLTTPKLTSNAQFSNDSLPSLNNEDSNSTPSSANQFHFSAVSPMSKSSSRSPSSKPPPVPLPDIPSPGKSINSEDKSLNHQMRGLNIAGATLNDKLKAAQRDDNDDESTNDSETTTDDTFIGHLPDDINADEFQSRSGPFRFGSTSAIPNDNRENNISQSPNHSRMASSSSANGRPTPQQQQQQQQQQQPAAGVSTLSRTMSVGKKFFGRHKKNASSTGERLANISGEEPHVKSNSISNTITHHPTASESSAHSRTLSDQSTAFKTPELPMFSNFDVLASPNTMRAGNRSQPHSRNASSSNPFGNNTGNNFLHTRSISQNENGVAGSIDSNLNNSKELATHYEQQLRSLKSEVTSFSANKAAILRDIQLLNNQKKTLEMEITEKQNKIKELDAVLLQKQQKQQKQPVQVQQVYPSHVSESTDSVPSTNDKSLSSTSVEDLRHSSKVSQPQQTQQTQSQQPIQMMQKAEIVEVNNGKKGGLMRRLFRGNSENTTSQAHNNSNANGNSPSSPKKLGKEESSGMTSSPSIQSIGAPTNFRTVEGNDPISLVANANNNNNNNNNINNNITGSSPNGFSSIIKSRSSNFLTRGSGNGEDNTGVSNSQSSNFKTPNPNNTTGLSLYDMTIQQRSNYENRLVPFIFTRCIEEIEKKGLYHEGLYRISGSTQAIDKLERVFDSSHDNGLITERDLETINSAMEVDVHVLVGLLKRYLRYIPSSVIPTEKYELFISIHQLKNPDEKLKKLKRLLNEELPKSNKFLLFQFAKHLNLVLEDKENKMNISALATVISNTLIMDDGKVPEKQALDVNAKREITELIISNHKDLIIL